MLSFLTPIPLRRRFHRFHSQSHRFPSVHINTCSATVPSDTKSAVCAIQTTVRTALLKGHKRLSVDILIAAVDARARTYNQQSAKEVLLALIQSIHPVLPVENPILRVVVAGPSAALRANKWTTELERVQVAVLGVDNPHTHVDAVILLEPGNDAVMEVRQLLKHMWNNKIPVVVVNHPREDDLYKKLGYGGGLPWEMTKFEPAFVLAPFALKKDSGDVQTQRPDRFVVMRQFPEKWTLWRYLGDAEVFGQTTTDAVEQVNEYHLCAQFDDRPSSTALAQAVQTELG